MSDKKFIITASSRSAIARAYGIDRRLLMEWIEAEPELKKLLKKYKRTFPPQVTQAIINIFGEP